MAITYRGEKFSGYNKPKRTPNHPKKSHIVVAKVGDTIKTIRLTLDILLFIESYK